MDPVQKSEVPSDGLLSDCLPRFDFADAYSLPISDEQAADIDGLARAAFQHVPNWILILMKLRNLLVRPLGLKTTYDTTSNFLVGPLEVGSRVGIFRVYGRTPTEILMGEDDKHLDFRVSLRVEGPRGNKQVLVATVVCFNSGLGRFYLALVRPFHKVIVPAVMRQSLTKYTF